MHHSSVILSLLEKAAELAKEKGGKKITKIRLTLEKGMDHDHFREDFELLKMGTLAEGAKLVISEGAEIILEQLEFETWINLKFWFLNFWHVLRHPG